jgi:hypothetical protein
MIGEVFVFVGGLLFVVAFVGVLAWVSGGLDEYHWVRHQWLDANGRPSSDPHVNRVCAVCRKVDLGGDRRTAALAHLEATRPQAPRRARPLAVVPPKGDPS